MNHNHGGGMDMSGGNSTACQISMLWNWTTIDACFLSTSWHIRNQGMFAATCIGVILLVTSIELLRRIGKEYDAVILRQWQRQAEATRLDAKACGASAAQRLVFRATAVQQFIRALLHAMTFGGAYIVMLLAMYFNGYIIICIFLGAGIGKFLCDWLVVRLEQGSDIREIGGGEGIKEPTVCCG